MTAAAAAAAAAVAQAIKASGAVVRVSPGDFLALLNRVPEPLVVVARGGVWKKHFRYLSGISGLVLVCQTPEPLTLPKAAAIVLAKKIWLPD